MTWPPEDIEFHDLGHGVSWSKVVDQKENWIGILEWHECGEKGLIPKGVYFENAPDDVRGARWKLVKEAPLTLGGSILCRSCGLHGFIIDGRWVPV